MVTMLAFLAVASPAEGLLTLTAGPAVALSNFGPGKTATGNGSVSITTDATTTSWTLQAADQGSGAGKMVAAATGCTGSDSTLKNPLQLLLTTTAAGVTSAGTVSLSSSSQTVASATGQAPLATAVLTANYSQVIPLAELMLTGCVYTITVAYTVQ